MAASSLPADLVHIHSFAAFRYFAGIGDRHPTRLFALLVDWLRYFDAYQHPVLFTDHSLFGGPPEQFHAVRNDLLLERLRFVVCVERSGQANVQAFAAARGLPIRLWWIPNPIDTDAFRPGPLRPTNPLVLGYAGRYEKEGTKDVLRLAREAPAWVAFRLALAVSERDRAQAEQDVAEAGVEVLWNVPYTAMPDFYRRLHVFLDPYTFGRHAPRSRHSLAAGSSSACWVSEELQSCPETSRPPSMHEIRRTSFETLRGFGIRRFCSGSGIALARWRRLFTQPPRSPRPIEASSGPWRLRKFLRDPNGTLCRNPRLR